MAQPNGKEVRIAITAQNTEEAAMLHHVTRSCGFDKSKVFANPRETFEQASRQQFQLFITHHDFPDMTGLTMIQSLRASGNYGLEPHLFMVNQINHEVMVVLAEHNIKYVVQKPYSSDLVNQKLSSLWKDERNLSAFEQDYREAHAAFQSGLLEMAYEMAIKALKTHKLQEKILLLLGDLELRMGRPSEARKFYEKAQSSYPDSYVATHKLAQVLMKEGNFLKAAALLDDLQKLSPLNIEILAHAGLSNFEIGKFPEAKSAMSRLRFLDHKRKDANEILARVAIQEGDLRNAVEFLKDSHPSEDVVRVIKREGLTFADRNSHLRAIDMYLSAIKILGPIPEAYDLNFQLGMAYAEIYDHFNAVRYLKRSLELKPDFEMARQAYNQFSSEH